MADDKKKEQAEPVEEQPVEAEASTDAEVLEVAAEAEAMGEEVIVVAEAPPDPDPEAPPEEPGPPVPEPTSPEPTPDPLPEPVAEAEEAPVAEADAGDETPVAAEGEEAPAEEQPASDESAPAAAPAATAKQKRKRIPRSERRQRPRAKRDQTGERKTITRQPKPEGERGRRQERRGIVVSAAMDKTIVVRVDTVKAHPKYKKVVRRSHRFHAHDEQNQAKAGDVVRIIETRPLSKTKNWRLAEVVEAAR